MIAKLENELLCITIKSKSAELSSIKSKTFNLEYLWQGDSAYWAGQSPLLFPTVGKVKNDEYRLEGKSYHLTNHGFARHSEFEIVENCANKAVFQLKFSDETLKAYPYKFNLQVIYTLEGNKLNLGYKVENLDDKDIYFSIGGHPAFNCPLYEDETMEDYYFQFSEKENCPTMDLGKEGFTHDLIPYLKDSDRINLSHKVFEEDKALVFHNLKSHSISLENNKNPRKVTLEFKGFPYLGLWTKANGAPFVCIEPWFGHGDYADFNGDFKDREGTLKLSQKEEFSASFSITIE